MCDNFDVKVTIKEHLKKGLVFGLKARLPIGIILGFVGYRHEVMPIMQTLSNATRAYIINANGLPAFVFEVKIMTILREADKRGQLENAKRWK